MENINTELQNKNKSLLMYSTFLSTHALNCPPFSTLIEFFL